MSIDTLSDPAGEPHALGVSQPSAELAPPMTTDAVQAVALQTISAVAVSSVEHIGRYTHAELQAMVGKRGRKPPEFHQLFPQTGAAAQIKKAKPAKAVKPRVARAKALPVVSSVIIGEHTIDELLAMIGTTGRKPVAFTILQQVAQVFVEAGAVELAKPAKAPLDPLLTSFSAAPKAVREAITALLAATGR